MERFIEYLNMEKDFDAFERLEKESFGKNANSDYDMHKWILDANPFNPESHNMMYVLKEGEKIIAADGLWPVPLFYHGKSYLAAHSIKSMTDPGYKRQGIFSMMTQNSVDMAKKSGIDLVFGLANKESYAAYQKFGWPTYFDKDVYVRPLRIEKLIKRKIKIGFLANIGGYLHRQIDRIKSSKLDKDYSYKLLESVPSSTDDVWQSNKGKYRVTIERSYKYLDYRYNKRPDVRYKVLMVSHKGVEIGYSIFRTADAGPSKVFSVCEFFGDPNNKEHLSNMFVALLEYARTTNADYMVASFGKFGLYSECSVKNGFKKHTKKPKNNMMIGHIINADITDIGLSGIENWHIGQGDGETELDL